MPYCNFRGFLFVYEKIIPEQYYSNFQAARFKRDQNTGNTLFFQSALPYLIF
jgi:hypothetical protein